MTGLPNFAITTVIHAAENPAKINDQSFRLAGDGVAVADIRWLAAGVRRLKDHALLVLQLEV